MTKLSATLAYGLLFLLSGTIVGCGGSNSTPPDPGRTAEIRRTEYGIPHIKADDWAGAGYGHGYAYAQDNYCVLMREIVVAAGQSQRYLGDEGDLGRDFVFALLGEGAQTEFLDELSDDAQAMLNGYVAGFNRYLAETGVDNLAEAEGEHGCRNEPWVRAITAVDYATVLLKLNVRASTDPLAGYIFAATPPDGAVSVNGSESLFARSSAEQNLANKKFSAPKNTKALLAGLDKASIARGVENLKLPKPEQLGSNAYAVGSSHSVNGKGMLLGNPHFPWQGASRFSMVHLTVGDEYDVMGAALHGFPMLNIGFNRDIAWSHTVSTGRRFVLYELKINPDNVMQYEYDGVMRDITAKTVSIEVVNAAGQVEQQEHTFYFSQFGPILDLGEVNPVLGGWPNGVGTLMSVKDLNYNNNRGFETWLKMGQATSIAELETALQSLGIPWVNTIAADKAGQAFYGDISVTANLSDAQKSSCIVGLVATLLTDNGLTTVDGSNPECELGTDADAPVPGIVGYAKLPKLINTTYAANANDSYWLSNPSTLLTGYASIIGDEDHEQSIRTRLTHLQMQQRLDGSDGLGDAGVSLVQLQQMLFGSRNLAAELLQPVMATVCDAAVNWVDFTATPASVQQACTLLASWDLTHNNDSVGGHIFYEFWQEARDIENLWAVDFDATDAVNTPNTANVTDATVLTALRQALADGVQTLLDNNIALNTTWGTVQFEEKNGVRIPIHGGSHTMLFSVITSELVPDEGYSAISHGNSYMQTVSWEDNGCPDAFALLSYSQSTDPASAHFADQTNLYSQKQWVDMPYCDDAIEEQQIGETLLLREIDE